MREAGGNRRHCGRSAAYRYGVSLKPHPRLLPEKDLLHLATMARNLGFKGSICPHPSWIEPVNAAFSPTSEQVAYYTKVREVFAEGVARGTAAVPLDGKMIDVPVDEWAKVVLHVAALCQARDEMKQQALQRAAAFQRWAAGAPAFTPAVAQARKTA